MELQVQKLSTELTAAEEKRIPTIKVRIEARQSTLQSTNEVVYSYKGFFVVRGADVWGSVVTTDRTLAFRLDVKDVEHLGIPLGEEGVKYNGGNYFFELPLRILFRRTNHPNHDFGFVCKYELLAINENGKRVIPHTNNFLPTVHRNMIIRDPDKMYKYLVLMDDVSVGELKEKLRSREKQLKGG